MGAANGQPSVGVELNISTFPAIHGYADRHNSIGCSYLNHLSTEADGLHLRIVVVVTLSSPPSLSRLTKHGGHRNRLGALRFTD